MNYFVKWRSEAEVQLIVLWIRAVNKQAITAFVDQIERILERDPHGQGESRNENTRLAFFRPLCVRYLVDDTTQTVMIVGIKWVGR